MEKYLLRYRKKIKYPIPIISQAYIEVVAMTEEEKKDSTDDEDTSKDGEETLHRAQEEMARMMSSVKDVALSNTSLLAAQAWHHLGLAPMSGAAESVVDLQSAKMAIDLLEANIKILEPSLEEEIVKELKQALMNLQLNYVNKTKAE